MSSQHEGPVYAAVLSPDASLVATGSGDGRVAIYRVADGTEVRHAQKHADAVYCVAYSRDGKLLASVGGNGSGGDTVCRIWDAATLTVKQELMGHTFPVYGAAFAPDGTTLATSSRDKTVRLWSLPGGECRVLTGHTSDVHRCVFSPDGKWLASASQDGTVRVWNVQQGTCRQVLSVAERGKPDPLYGVAFSPDGKRLAAVGDDFRLHIWNAADFRVLAGERLAQRCTVCGHVPARSARHRDRGRGNGHSVTGRRRITNQRYADERPQSTVRLWPKLGQCVALR